MQAPEPSSGRRKLDILRQALRRKTPIERAAFLDGACGGDAALRVEVEALLASHEEAEGSPAQAAEAGNAPPVEGTTGVMPTRPDETPLTEGPGTVIGRYKLLEQIGEGGFGVVYVAEQQEPVRRQVALKIIKLGMDTRQVVARFEAERQALALMDHPNIAKVFDAGATDSGRPFFVMELVKGIPIPQYCDQEKLATRDRLDLFIGVCHAIQHAHQKGIIHRDIKPSNILVTVQEGKPVPKVIDFGIAKATQQKLTEKTLHTQLQQFIGTPAYMSPEQAEMSGLDIDTRSDIYSLGVLLYELLVGKTPFDAKELLAAGLDGIRRTIREQEPARPSTRLSMMGKDELTTTTQHRGAEAPKLIGLLRGDLDWIVMKCLEKDRTRRYETANGLAADLKRFLDNQPVLARPPSPAYRVRKFVRRHRAMVAAAAAVGGALVLGIFGSTWQAVRATRAEGEQSRLRKAAEAANAAANSEANKARQAAEAEKRNLYIATMRLAQLGWEQNDVSRVEQSLEETAAYPEPGFEWYYWQRQTHLATRTFRGHLDAVRAVAFSPDGRRVVTGSNDGTAKVWDAATGKELFTLRGHRAVLRSVAFSPNGDYIATGSHDGTAKLWDAATGGELHSLRGRGAVPVNSLAFSPDGKRVFTCHGDAVFEVWEVLTGNELPAPTRPDNSTGFVVFSSYGPRLITTGSGGSSAVWDAASGKKLLTLEIPIGGFGSAAFSPDGQRVVVGVREGAKVWEVATGRELLTLNGRADASSSVAFSPDGRRIATGSADGIARVWDAAGGTELFTLKGHHHAIICAIAFSPQGDQVLTGSLDGTARLWDLAGTPQSRAWKGHGSEIRSVAFSPEGLRILTGGGDRTVRVWETATGKELFRLTGHRDQVRSVAFSPDGKRIATAGDDQVAKLWDADKARELLSLTGHSDRVRSVAFSPDGRRILTGSYDRTAKVWDAASGRELFTLTGHKGPIFSAVFSPDGQRIVTGSADQAAKLWDVAGRREMFTLSGHTAPVFSVAFSPDGRWVVTGSADQTARLWDASSGKQIVPLKGHRDRLNSVAFSPDGSRVLTGAADSTVRVWDALSGQELLTLKEANGSVWSVAFSSDGQRIAAGSGDGMVWLWETASSARAASWVDQDRAAADHIVALQRERADEVQRERTLHAQDAGAIKRWLVLAPIAEETGDVTAAVRREQIPGEAKLRPIAGHRLWVGDCELVWRSAELPDYVLDFNDFLGEVTAWSVAYAVCYIQSETDQSGLLMNVGSDDTCKVYLNEREIYQREIRRSFVLDQDVVTGVELRAGPNVLIFKVANWYAAWLGSIRFTDAQGNPVRGIKVTLDPEAADHP